MMGRLGGGAAATIVVATWAAIGSTGAAQAQSMSPMRGEVRSFSDEFAIRVTPANVYQHRIQVEVRVYDERFAPVAARVHPATMTLGPNGSRRVVVMVPFDGAKQRRVRVCTESVPFASKTQQVRTQICGRFLATRVN